MYKFLWAVITVALCTSCAQTKNIDQAAGTYPAPKKGSFRILCYNTHNAIGMDNQVSYDRIAAVINNVQPQLVALQELDSVTERSKGVDVLKVLAEKTGMHPTYGAAINYKGGKYGVGVLSKEKPISSSQIPLPGREEQRTLLMVEFKDYVLFCTHFSLTEADRVASAKLVNEQKKRFNKKIFLAGDLNATPQSEAITILKQDWELLSGEAFTIPSTKPNKCIDYIFASKPHKYNVTKKEVINEPVASDHLPLYVDVK
jgi:endonuclease/exonuclease/phosphatase family metal-dependent hydrolase